MHGEGGYHDGMQGSVYLTTRQPKKGQVGINHRNSDYTYSDQFKPWAPKPFTTHVVGAWSGTNKTPYILLFFVTKPGEDTPTQTGAVSVTGNGNEQTWDNGNQTFDVGGGWVHRAGLYLYLGNNRRKTRAEVDHNMYYYVSY